MKKVALYCLLTLGLLLLLAIPDEETTTTGVFFAQLIATKAGAFACFAAVIKLYRQMEKAGKIDIEEE